MKKLTTLTLSLFLTGCASNLGVFPIASDTFMIFLGDATGFSELDTLKADAYQEANQYCFNQNKNIRVVNITDSSPPYILGNFPRVKIQFMCFEKTEKAPGKGN